jgi:hypothetical protein
MHLRQGTSKHYFSCSGGPSADPIKSVRGHVMPKFCFCIRCDLRVTLCVRVRPGLQTLKYYFSCSGGPSVDPIKNHQDTLHRSCGFASGAICGSHSVFGCIHGVKHRCTIFHARAGPVYILQEARQGTLC